jgi:AAA15 family ATPase/GTPase
MIKRLKVKWFRGIVETDLEFDGKSIILFGENGQGKSSFVDALEFLFKGQVSYLEEAQTTSTSRHVPHIASDKKNCEVEIEFQDGSKIIRNFKQGLSEIPTHIQLYFQQGVESPFILRRKYLLDFILAQPAPRYERLSSLIRISDLENVELSLMRKRDKLQEDVDRIKSSIADIQEQTKRLLGKELESEEQLLVLLNEKLRILGQSPLNSFNEIVQRKTNAISSAKSPEEMTKASEVNKAIEIVEQLKNKLATFEKHKVFWDKVLNLQQDKEKLKELMFKQLLEQGQNLIKQTDSTKCPLCLQPIDRDEILSSIEARLCSLEYLSKQISEIKTAKLTLQEDLKKIIDNIEVLVNALRKMGYINDLKILTNLKEQLKKLNEDVSKEPADMKIKPFEEECKEIFDNNIRKFLQEGVFNWLKNEQQKFAPTEKDKITIQIIDLLTKSAEIREKFAELLRKLKAKERITDQVDNIYKCFLETKHSEVQKIYDSLQTDFTRYYQILHPGEEHKDIKLVVKPERRGSAEIRSTFYDRIDEDPRGFNSEAHLDSLGLCIFLAFVKHFNKDFPLIILDDVIFSIDATHRNRVSDLIYKEFADYQFLITTHDYMWFEELQSAQRAFKLENNFRNLKIIKWSLNEGPIIDKYKPRWQEIESKIDRGDKDGAARDSRNCLEWLCYEMVVGLRTSPVYLKRNNRYEVRDLYQPFIDRVKKLSPEFYKNNEAIFQQLEKNSIFGNILSHNNPIAGNVSINEVKDFVDSLLKVYNLFFCPKCSSLVQYHQTARIIKCSCGEKTWNTK